MIYKIDNINISNYNLLPIEREGSNIPIAGIFDLPTRIGKTHHVWEEGVEPYVAKEEIFFSGIDIRLNCLLEADNLWKAWIDLKDALSAFDDLVELNTPYGNYLVYVRDQISFSEFTNNCGIVDLVFRRPIVEIEEVSLPSMNGSSWALDGLSFEAFDAFVMQHDVTAIRPEQLEFQSTVYGIEPWKVNKYSIGTIELPLLISASVADFNIKIKQLQYALMRPGIRRLTRAGVTYNTFCKDGFRFSQLWEEGNQLNGILTIPFTYLGEYRDLQNLYERANKLIESGNDLKGVI